MTAKGATVPPFCERHLRWYEVIWRWPFSGHPGEIACPDCKCEEADNG